MTVLDLSSNIIQYENPMCPSVSRLLKAIDDFRKVFLLPK